MRTPQEARAVISRQVKEAGIEKPANLEEQAISLVGLDIYKKLIQGYTQKQWGISCRELPASIIRRIPVRFTFNNNYFDHPYQGIPIGGYTKMVAHMLQDIEVWLNTDYLQQRDALHNIAKKIVFTGPVDAYFDYCYGALSYRSLGFETEVLDQENYQGTAGMNFTDEKVPYTRIVEHKHFEFLSCEKTVITKEYPREWNIGDEPYYPVETDANKILYKKYAMLADKEKNVQFCGRLGVYQYLDMDKVILRALRHSA